MSTLLDLPGDPASTRIVVAMSGGVDSSVVAALLARAGYDVVGITLQLYESGAKAARKGACCAGADIHDARRAAETIGIPHYVLDYEDRFREAVVDRFAESYLAGETPIPCVECNKSVKFTDLLRTAHELGAAALATGHYVVSKGGPQGRTLHRAADPTRDQSYFLYATTQTQLDFLRFPLGGIPKDETRRLAAELGLAVANKPDSQDICFVPNGRYQDVLLKLRPEAARPGEVVHVDGRVLGRHEGIIGFTVGQRRGLGIASSEPLYVISLDAARARVVVGPRSALAVTRIALREVNWLGERPVEDLPADGLAVAVKVRSTRPPAPARLFWTAEGVVVELDGAAEGVAPGQACVVYDGEDAGARVLGGGVIRASLRTLEPIRTAA
ncbi:tRNA 2-thiouridine(34) synthase MnmA [Enterovirga rhinocerotis]|uniref:tRNA-specific 2-thiouridylase MnmA n=1 Tax=Enterovirga rhinocerotis TaxID=1339210 RepID=A0A4R7BW68_9HYPH|nr:tRNA 2-thiouridine(34) synthase MnmA [Enterovirga rhinocerotis]TDR90110.1 tRNA (5-methylaminomethyl-2-thiouridylate)-methyltransferase [Enterovirga rhinocerotis]